MKSLKVLCFFVVLLQSNYSFSALPEKLILIASETADDTGQFIINFNAPAKKNIRIKFKLSGIATKGKNYERIPNSIVIPAGNTQGIIEIIPINDTKKEGIEKVIVALEPDSLKRYKLRGRKKAVVTILDND
jgi:hypothetical protein